MSDEPVKSAVADHRRGDRVQLVHDPRDRLRRVEPRGEQHRISYKGLDCRACFHPDCSRGEQNCMRLITVDEVWAAAQELLRR